MTPTQIDRIADLRAILDEHRGNGLRIGFVPTMGFLHDGHGSLMRAARANNDIVVTSIFVNPLQFAAGEDLEDYPRDLSADARLAGEAGVDVLFTPSVVEMYPRPMATVVAVPELATRWEGTTRPTHFSGVATVVAKLFNVVGPSRAYFGEKDFQQLCIVRRMVADLSIPVDVIGCPIVREPDGLARSSRNIYLTPAERAAAPVLRQALDAGLDAVRGGERDPQAVMVTMARVVASAPLAKLDYVAATDAATLEVPARLEGTIRLMLAVKLGKPRLIDNDGITIDS